MGWFVSKEGREIEVKDHDGNVGHVWIKEMSEADSRKRTADLVRKANISGASLNRMGNDLGSLNMDYAKVAVEQRTQQMEQGIIRWDFTDEDGKEVPVTPEAISNLPSFVSDQIHNALQELNSAPQDDVDEKTGEVIEHPTLHALDAE